jgi:hypothetical protein
MTRRSRTVGIPAGLRFKLGIIVGMALVVPGAVLVSAGGGPSAGVDASPTTDASGMSDMAMGADQCLLPQLAFCDTFQTIVGGGREGDLDPAKWSFTRVTEGNNPAQNQVDNYAPSLAQFCKTTKMVQPDGDSFICGAQFNESNHWMDSMNDNGNYALNSARIRQPFDFAGRTGNIVFDVDNKTEGPHSFWTEVWITDQPVQGPHVDHPGTHIYPRNGVGFVFNADWCGGGLQGANALREIDVFQNYDETVNTVRSPCFTTMADMANHFQIKISSTNIEVWASDAGGANFRMISSTNLPPLPFTRGYVSFEHAQYNAAKFNSTNTMTYHWHAIGFDGPVIAPDRGYEVPDALTPGPGGTVNLGYEVPTPTFQLPNVDLTNIASAYLTYNAYFFMAPKSMTATINGVNRTAADPNPDAASSGGYQWRYMMQPVALSDLRQGTNTVSFRTACGSDQCPTIADVDLELVPNAGAPSPPPPPPPTTTTTMPMPTTTVPMPTTTAPPPTTTVPRPTTTTMPPTTTTAPQSGGSVALDTVTNTSSTPAPNLVSPAFNTRGSGELLVAFLSSDGPAYGSVSFTSVSGGGLTWHRAAMSNAQAGDAEIWTAFATSRLSNVRVTATRSSGWYEGQITVAAFTGASSVTGSAAGASGPSGAPAITLNMHNARSWVWGVGHDWDGSMARTLPYGQTLVSQYTDWGIGDTSWVQRQTSAGSTASSVTLSDTAPTNHRWNIAAIEIRPA